jgi:hypothetical protein
VEIASKSEDSSDVVSTVSDSEIGSRASRDSESLQEYIRQKIKNNRKYRMA